MPDGFPLVSLAMLFTRRLHGIEMLDNPRCPAAIRDGALDYLRFIINAGHAYRPIVAVLAPLLIARQRTHIVDCCSGGGGPWPSLRNELVRAGVPADLRVTLTDAFPNVDAFHSIAASDARVTGSQTPVNIETPESLAASGARTLFSSFHHFQPEVAVRVLRNLAAHGDEIFIAEVTERSLRAVLFMLLAPLLVWLATPALRPFRFSRLVLTYLLPAIPFVVCFDGIVSCLRTYTCNELRELTTLAELAYDWDVGQARGAGPLSVTYLTGVPRAR